MSTLLISVVLQFVLDGFRCCQLTQPTVLHRPLPQIPHLRHIITTHLLADIHRFLGFSGCGRKGAYRLARCRRRTCPPVRPAPPIRPDGVPAFPPTDGRLSRRRPLRARHHSLLRAFKAATPAVLAPRTTGQYADRLPQHPAVVRSPAAHNAAERSHRRKGNSGTSNSRAAIVTSGSVKTGTGSFSDGRRDRARANRAQSQDGSEICGGYHVPKRDRDRSLGCWSCRRQCPCPGTRGGREGAERGGGGYVLQQNSRAVSTT